MGGGGRLIGHSNRSYVTGIDFINDSNNQIDHSVGSYNGKHWIMNWEANQMLEEYCIGGR